MAQPHLTPEQRKVAAAIHRIARQRHESPMEEKAAFETGLVEANLTNPSGHTDHDSQGWRQERDSLYKNPTNLTASINRFFDETSAVQGKYGNAGELAAAVQRPAAQYRGRYGQHSGQADAILKMFGAGGGGVAAPPTAHSAGVTVDLPTSEDKTSFDQDGFAAAGKRAMLGAFLERRNPHSLLLRTGAVSSAAPNPADFTKTTTEVGTEKFTVPGTSSSTAAGSTSSGPFAAQAEQRADQLDAKHFNYVWGGNHGATNHLTPADCSGAVSYVTGVDPRVASQFKTWGQAGAGGGDASVRVYAKDDHVLMAIKRGDGKFHFFGTSRTNPGGGAGWIPESALSKQYLAGFTVRHSTR